MPRINDLEVDQYLHDCVTITPEAIQEEFIRLPADIAYWGELYAQAMKDHLMAKQQREQIGAKLHLAIQSTSTVKLTVADFEVRITTDPDYYAAKLYEIEKEATKASIKARLDAVVTKKDMVISLGAQLRVEMGHDPVVREAVRGARLAKEGW